MDISFEGEAFAHETITIGTAATAGTFAMGTANVTPNNAPRANGALITAGSLNFRWRCDGGQPGSTDGDAGHTCGSLDSITLVGNNNLRNFKAFFYDGAADDTLLHVTYFR